MAESSRFNSAPHSVQLHVEGVVLRLRASDGYLLQQLTRRGLMLQWTVDRQAASDVEYVVRRLPADDQVGAAPSFELRRDGGRVLRTPDLDRLLEAFDNDAKIQMAYRATGSLFVHAGVVGWHHRAILIPGRSHSGKTTLVAALVAHGAEYYSDEFAVLDRDGRVRPYSIPLSVRGRAGEAPLKVAVESFGGRAGTGPLAVGLIVVTRYQRAARWRPRPLSPGQALLALMDNTVAARRSPEFSMPVLRRAVLDARTFRTLRGDANTMASSLLAELR